ncbi:hypothetical protein ACWC4A_54540 [Streptomyces mirabilis]
MLNYMMASTAPQHAQEDPSPSQPDEALRRAREHDQGGGTR